MKTEQDFRAAIDAKKAEYDTAVPTQPAHICHTISEEIVALQRGLSDLLSEGASPCVCGEKPFGTMRTPAHESRGVELPATYEVLCLVCSPKRCARAISPAEAVNRWNARKLVSIKG